MINYTYKVAKEHEGMSVGAYLKNVHGVSAKSIKTLKLRPKGLTLNGEHIRAVDIIKEGDLVAINPKESCSEFQHSDIYVEILYEDEDVIVYNKPANMPCHPARNHHNDTVGNVFAKEMARRGIQSTFRCINRLDKDTSGTVAVAKTQHAAHMLQQALKKSYVGIIKGALPETSGDIIGNIQRIDEMSIKRRVHPDGQFAKTHYEFVRSANGHSLYRFTLHTGRTHQIRVHMSSIGAPLAGDLMYGGDCGLIGRQALHCEELSFYAVRTKELVIVRAPLPADMAALIGE